jgi:anti-sigma B factor antagonist
MSTQDCFEVVVRGEGREPVLEVHGEMDFATAPTVLQHIDDALKRGTSYLVIDLAQCTFIDSAGMSALVRGHLKATSFGTTFRIRHAIGNARRALDVCGLSDVLLESP